ncbi:hypothetical protein M2140_001746 [Clostridiales Family XIII bacterium PM5-7]
METIDEKPCRNIKSRGNVSNENRNDWYFFSEKVNFVLKGQYDMEAGEKNGRYKGNY